MPVRLLFEKRRRVTSVKVVILEIGSLQFVVEEEMGCIAYR